MTVNQVFLMGYRGTGKSSVAGALGEKLSWEVIDTDREIVARAGKSIAQIFAEDGEDVFRDWEVEIVAAAANRQPAVVSLGGGAILRAETRQLLLANANPVVWLRADANTIMARLEGDRQTAAQRPALTDFDGLNEIKRLLEQRRPLYRECATISVDTDDNPPAEIADRIATLINASS